MGDLAGPAAAELAQVVQGVRIADPRTTDPGAPVGASLDAIRKANDAMPRLTPLGCGVALPADRELGLPTPAEPERVAPASASRSGPVPRVGASERRW
jgi:hypothetical protein